MQALTVDADPFSPEILTEPYEFYRELRAASAVAYFPKYDAYALTRYQDVRDALSRSDVYSSASGVGLNEIINGVKKNLIQTDPPDHDRLRRVLGERLGPRAIRPLREIVRQKAQTIVDGVLSMGSFEAIGEIALALPVSVIIDFVGYPPEDREKLSVLGYNVFNAFGPPNDLLPYALGKFEEMMSYLLTEATVDRLRPGSMGADVYAAADRGDIDPEEAVQLMVAYTTAGMDTTMSAIGTAIYLFGTYPDEWDKARANPLAVRAAMNEVLRYDAPIQWFSRLTLTDHEVDGILLPAQSRVILYMGSANRDERKWDNPDQFDISRDAGGQLAFGYGLHGCSGQALARLEFEELFCALAERVARIEIQNPQWPIHNLLRSISSMQATLRLDN